jgi:hypothetical protein
MINQLNDNFWLYFCSVCLLTMDNLTLLFYFKRKNGKWLKWFENYWNYCQRLVGKRRIICLKISFQNIKISEFVGGAATAFIIVGVTILALVVWAYCGICCKSKWMLIVVSIQINHCLKTFEKLTYDQFYTAWHIFNKQNFFLSLISVCGPSHCNIPRWSHSRHFVCLKQKYSEYKEH